MARMRSHARLPRTNRPGDAFERSADLAALAPAPLVAPAAALTPLAESPAQASQVALGGGESLDRETRATMETRFGHDFSRVRVHSDGEAAATASALGAAAWTLGRDIVFGPGRYQPHSAGGRDLLAHELAHVVQQTGQPALAGMSATRPPAGIAQARHLTIDEAVKAFIAKVEVRAAGVDEAALPNIHEMGQFYWSIQIGDAIKAQYTQVLADPSWDKTEADGIRAALESVLNAIYGYDPKKWELITAALKAIRASKNPLKSRLEALFVNGSRLSGGDISALLWRYRNSKDLAPELKPYRTIPVFDRVHDAEASACGQTAGLVINRFYDKGGFGDEDPDKMTRDKRLRGKGYSVASGVRRHKAATGPPYLGDEVRYGGALAAAIPEIKRALDAGFVVHARVMSGIGVSGPPRLHSEHSIVIIGYDGDQFVFWDPDSGASRSPQPGFGFLYSILNRFGTASSDETQYVDEGGNHLNGNHRYQVLTMFVN